VVGAALVLFTIVTVFTLARPRQYTAAASFMPQTDASGLSRLASLGAQFGLSIPTGAGAQSPEFYAELVRSRGIMGIVVESEYALDATRGILFMKKQVYLKGTLVEVLEIDAESALLARDLAIEMLLNSTAVSTGRETGIVTIAVTTRWPELSRLLTTRLVELVNEFNQHVRSTQASSERRFVESRLADVKQELRHAEDQLEAFLNQNRMFREAPALAFQYERLQREVALRQQMVLALAQAFEQARIEEVRNTPVITMVDAPELPQRPDRRRLLVKAGFGILVGAALGVGWALVVEFGGSGGAATRGEVEEFGQLRRDALRDLRRLVPGRQRVV
jgi:uncharacterized protein involved in exopolysaccharide biosynthesis